VPITDAQYVEQMSNVKRQCMLNHRVVQMSVKRTSNYNKLQFTPDTGLTHLFNAWSFSLHRRLFDHA